MCPHQVFNASSKIGQKSAVYVGGIAANVSTWPSASNLGVLLSQNLCCVRELESELYWVTGRHCLLLMLVQLLQLLNVAKERRTMPTSNAIVPPHLKLFACLCVIVTIQCARRSISTYWCPPTMQHAWTMKTAMHKTLQNASLCSENNIAHDCFSFKCVHFLK